MKVDEKATKQARKQQAAAIERLNELFRVDSRQLSVGKDQRWLAIAGKKTRRLYREARAKADPRWSGRRRARKRRRLARKANR